jgi:hypothetical protein
VETDGEEERMEENENRLADPRRFANCVFDRLLTFRGDTDDPWRRAEVFVAEQMTVLDIDK